MTDEYSIIKPRFKSVAAALLFTVILGPVGLLYATFWGGFVMIVIGVVVVCSKFVFPIILLWLACCIWGVGAIERYNQKITQTMFKKSIL